MKKPGEVEQEDELDEGALSSGEDDDARREIGEQEARRFGAFRKDREDFDKKADSEGQAGKPAEKGALAGAHTSGSSAARVEGSAPAAPMAPTATVAAPSGPQAPVAPGLGAISPVATGEARKAAAAAIEQQLAAEMAAKMQKTAGGDAKRSVYGAPLNKTPSTPAKTEAPASPSLLKPTMTAKPMETVAPRRPAPPPPAPAASSAMKVPPTRVDARAVLSTGKPSGTLFKHFPLEQNVSPAVQGAVAEAQRLLAGLKGIGRVIADTYKDKPVIRIDVQQGLTREGMRAIPNKVNDVMTVIHIDFGVLPLRRSLGGK